MANTLETKKNESSQSEHLQTNPPTETLCLLSWKPDTDPRFRHQILTIHTGQYSTEKDRFTTTSGREIDLSGFQEEPASTANGHERESNGEIISLEKALPIHLVNLWHRHFTVKDISPDLGLADQGKQLTDHLMKDFVLVKSLSIIRGKDSTHIAPGKPIGTDQSPYHLLKKPLEGKPEHTNFKYRSLETNPNDWVLVLNKKDPNTLQISLVRGHQDVDRPHTNRIVGVKQEKVGKIDFYQYKYEEEPVSFDVKIDGDVINILADRKVKDLLAHKLGFRGDLESLTRSLLEIDDSKIKVDDRINLKDGSVDQICTHCGQAMGTNIIKEGILQKSIDTVNCSKCSSNDYRFDPAKTTT